MTKMLKLIFSFKSFLCFFFQVIYKAKQTLHSDTVCNLFEMNMFLDS